jgi:hypothetical protein
MKSQDNETQEHGTRSSKHEVPFEDEEADRWLGTGAKTPIVSAGRCQGTDPPVGDRTPLTQTGENSRGCTTRDCVRKKIGWQQQRGTTTKRDESINDKEARPLSQTSHAANPAVEEKRELVSFTPGGRERRK